MVDTGRLRPSLVQPRKLLVCWERNGPGGSAWRMRGAAARCALCQLSCVQNGRFWLRWGHLEGCSLLLCFVEKPSQRDTCLVAHLYSSFMGKQHLRLDLVGGFSRFIMGRC